MMHARLGAYARWYCKGCTVKQYHDGLWACSRCCGYTTNPLKIVRDVLTAHGQHAARSPR